MLHQYTQQGKQLIPINQTIGETTKEYMDNGINEEKEGWQDYLQQELREELEEYSAEIAIIQLLVDHSPIANNLVHQNPLLFWLLACYSKQQGWNKDRLISVSQQPPLEILKSCGLPNKQSTLSCLQIIDVTHYSGAKRRKEPTHFEVIYSLLKHDVSKLIQRKAISISLAELIYEHPELIDARFILLNKCNGMRFIGPDIRDIKRLAQAIDYPKTRQLLKRCRHTKDIKLAKTRLQRKVSDALIRELNKLDDLSIYPEETISPYLNDLEQGYAQSDWLTLYQQSPIPTNEHIKSLTNFSDILIEAHTQHNCLTDYHYEIEAGECFAYQVLVPERATVTLVAKDNFKGLRIDELRIKDNQQVSNKTRRSVVKWLNKGNQLLKQQARHQQENQQTGD